MKNEQALGSKGNIVEPTQQKLITKAIADFLTHPEAIALDNSRRQLAAANATLEKLNQENITGVNAPEPNISDGFASALGLHKQMEAAIARQAEIDSLLSRISRQFIDSDADAAINFALAKIGEFTGSDRSYILRYGDNQSKVYNTHEWCAEGIKPYINELQGLLVEDYHWCYSQLLNGNVISIPSLMNLPPEAAQERAELERESIQSVLYVPMICEGIAVGCIGLDAVRSPKVWSRDDIHLLKFVGDTIAIAQARDEAEKALQRSNMRYQNLAANIPGMIYQFLLRPNGSMNFVYVSPGSREIFGIEPEAIMGNSAFTFGTVHPDDHPNLIKSIIISAQTIEPWHQIWRIFLEDKIKWIEGKSRPEKQADGSILWDGLLTDISERKRAEEELRHSEEKFRTLFETLAIGIMISDDSGNIIQCNPASAKILGLSISEHQKRHLSSPEWKLFRPDGTMMPVSEYPAVIALKENRTVEGVEVAVKKGNNQMVWLDVTVTPMPLEGYGIQAAYTDITARKLAEQALRESAERERAIARVIQRMRQTLDIETIFNATSDELRQAINCDRVGVYRFNPDWSGNFVAESVANGWSPIVQIHQEDPNIIEKIADSNCIVQKLSCAANVQDSYLQKTCGAPYSQGINCLVVEDIYSAGFAPCHINLLERLQARSYIIVPIFCGSQLWGLLASYQNSGPRLWSAAEISMVIQIGTQLGVALQQAQLLAQTQKQSEALQAAVIAADAANRAKSEFLASMSHELRTPLNAILGFTQMMSRDRSLKQDQQENLRIINGAGEHLLELINDILEMSKIEAGRTALNLRSFDLIRLLTTLEEMLRLKAQSKRLKLIFDIAPDLPKYVQADQGKLRQVLINILGNAIKFTEAGSVTLRVKTGIWRLLFEVEDTGPGIATEEIGKLFEAFVQTETGKKSQQGTGLGLPISQKFVELMGGKIEVSSLLGKGTVFTFDIQISSAGSGEIEIENSPQQVISLAPNQPEYRILVADDRPESRLMLTTLFTSIGFSVREAENGQEAVAIWESWEPHLICMDMRMPVMDGYEATKQIKAHLKGQSTTIIALTANAFEEDRKMVLSAGCNDFVGKPFREEVLLEKVSQHLGVVYVYEEENLKTEAGSETTVEILTDVELKSYLEQMPSEWVAQLHYASHQGSDDQIFDLLKQVPSNQVALANALRNLANDFQFLKIIQLLPSED